MMIREFDSILKIFAASIVFVSEPSSSILAVNEVVQFRCAAYVSVLYSVMTLTWSDENSGTTPSENDGFSFYNETLEASGILFVTSVLSFSGSTQLVTYNLSCTANVLGIPLVHKPFFLSVTTETGEATVLAYITLMQLLERRVIHDLTVLVYDGQM